MAKQVLKQRDTQVATESGVGQEVERTLTVDDNSLPTPQELAAYREIDPRIVDFLLDAAQKEQEHRHVMDKGKLDLVKKADNRKGRINWWGMFFAFLSILVLVLLSGYALYLDRPWFAGIMCAGTLFTVASIFVNKDNQSNKKK